MSFHGYGPPPPPPLGAVNKYPTAPPYPWAYPPPAAPWIYPPPPPPPYYPGYYNPPHYPPYHGYAVPPPPKKQRFGIGGAEVAGVAFAALTLLGLNPFGF